MNFDSRKTERETIKMTETMVNGMKFKVWNDTTRRATFAESEDGRVEKIHDYGYITADLTIRKAIAMVYGLPTFRKNAVKTASAVEETTAPEAEQTAETVETEIAEKVIMRLSDDDGNVLVVKIFVGTYKQADEEAERIMAETGCYVSYVRYTDSRWNWMSREYYCVTDSESALTIVSPITMKIEQAPETAEQETELNTEVETEQTEETKDENTHIWVTKEAYLYLRDEMRKQRGFKPLTKEQKERMIIHITKNGMSNKIRLNHNSLGGGDGTKDGRWWGWNVVTLKKLLKKAGYSYET